MQREAVTEAGWYSPLLSDEFSSHSTAWRRHVANSNEIQAWRYSLLEMAIDLSYMFRDVHKVLSLSKEDEKNAWAAACNMDDHPFFRDIAADLTPTDAVSFVKRRLTFVIRCLKCIQGPAVEHIHEMYIDPWSDMVSAM